VGRRGRLALGIRRSPASGRAGADARTARPLEDQWRLAELTFEQVKVNGKTQSQWAKDVGVTQPYASYLVKIGARYNGVIDRPTFANAYAEAQGMPVDRVERREDPSWAILRS
jgi:hypothetical protein